MYSQRFQNQTAVVTGACSGLGLAISSRLLAEGAFVALVDHDQAGLDRVLPGFAARGCGFAVDVTDEPSVASAMATLSQRRERIDVLVNCVGITGRTNIRSHEVAVEDFDQVYRVNVRGPFLVAKHVLPVMLRAKSGRILHVASIAGKDGNAGMAAYSSSKAALIGLTKVQGKEYAKDGITVNALAPAVVRTPLVAAMPEEQVRYMTDKIPMGRCGTLDEVAAMAAFIVSAEASFTTGAVFDLTGGRAVY